MALTQIMIYWGDGFIQVDSPFAFPDSIYKNLKYYHRSLEWDERLMRRVSSGEYRNLYTFTHGLRDGEYVQQILTYPGFAHRLVGLFRKEALPFEFVDVRTPPPTPDIAAAMAGLREYQYEGAYTCLASGGGVLACPTGWGKCMCPDTNVLHTNGEVKRIGDIAVGDTLMGDDSTPRRVLNRIDGNGPMYRITPKTGQTFDVADHHILCLVQSGDCKRDKYPAGHIVQLTVADYLQRSKTFKHRHKLYRVPVAFDEQSVTVDPYWLGLWLGDGDWYRPNITTEDAAIVAAIYAYADTMGLAVTNSGVRETHRTPSYAIVKTSGKRNPLTDAMRAYGLLKSRNKFIPQEFMTNSREIRLQLLAGLMDSDGSLNAGTDFDFVNTNHELANSVAFLARSLGLLVHDSVRKCTGFGVTVDASRLRITGDTHLVPTRLKHKQAVVRRQKKNPLRTGFTIERIDDGPYVGVQLDGNHRYLLGDCTVTHNTHLMSAIIKAYDHKELIARNTPITVVATPEKEITRKDYNDLVEMFPDRDVGLIMSGKNKYSEDIQVCTLDSLHRLTLDEVGLLIVDEVHTAPTEARTNLILSATKALRWGVSATPAGRFDGRDRVTEGLFGPVVYHRTYEQGITDGALVPIKIFWVPAGEPSIGMDSYDRYSARTAKYRHGIERNENRNKDIVTILRRMPPALQTLCIMKHLAQMDHIIAAADFQLDFVHGTERQEDLTRKRLDNLAPVRKKERIAIYDRFAAGEIRRILSTHIYKQGVNFPQLSVIINAGGGGASIAAAQIPGRESRNIDGKDESYLIDFYHPWDTVTELDGRLKDGPIRKDDLSREKVYTRLGFEQVWLNSVDELPLLEPTA